jgi:uncharacterized protein YndB with AHSA1/START domain
MTMRGWRSLWQPVEVRRTMADVGPEAVFAVVADPDTYPRWLIGAQRIRHVDETFPAPGSSFDHSVGASPTYSIDDSSEVLDVEPDHRLVLRVHVGPVDGSVELIVEPVAAGSLVVFREVPEGWPKLVLPALRPVLRGRNAESLRRLEQVVVAATRNR